MNTENEALDRRKGLEMRNNKYSMLGGKWSGWCVTPTAPLEPNMDGKENYVSTMPIICTNSQNLVAPSGLMSPSPSIS